ncbi:hypothetical protein BD408DRAFT_343184 [Parasitella parasitica]|nr:hypothetical protein BD408DRAFT_343184 [Parasitella parasitica]
MRLFSDKINTVCKDNAFSEQVTRAEQVLIEQRVALQQQQFKEFEKRERIDKIRRVKSVYKYLTNEEIIAILEESGNNEQEAIVRLTQPAYLCTILKSIALKHATEVETNENAMNEEQQSIYAQTLQMHSKTLEKITDGLAKQPHGTGQGRFGLDEALKQMRNNSDGYLFEGWSSARIRAYQMAQQNPNSYYYRFNAPGEEQRKGKWTEEERTMFHQRLEQVGSNGQWGIFSIKIPGRVGYQCSNFYRLLVETNKIQDPNYVLDEYGKAHYLFEKKRMDSSTKNIIRTHRKHGSRTHAVLASATAESCHETPSSAKEPTASNRHRKKRKMWSSEEGDCEDKSGTFKLRSSTRQKIVNSLPGFMDPITLEEVVKPAISTYGHVMGYDSWVRCLTNWEGKKSVCPLTKRPLTRRDLTILIVENIEAYQDKIIQ